MQNNKQELHIYTIRTHSGREHQLSESMDRLLEEGVITDKFVPMRVRAFKTKDGWTQRIDILFPGYLFVETADPKLLFERLKYFPGISQNLLSDGDSNYYKLPKEEVLYINKIGALRKDHTFGISQVEIDDTRPELKVCDRVKIISGDLLKFQKDITRFDLHHRKAFLKTSLFGGYEFNVGVELIQNN